jgi:hypothetical protein
LDCLKHFAEEQLFGKNNSSQLKYEVCFMLKSPC